MATTHLTKALSRCRGINMVDHEADILLDLARLRVKQGGTGQEAERLAQEALALAERCGYVLQAADAHLVLAGLVSDSETHAREALRLATCDGEPYVYRAAYEEAKRWLEGM